MTRVAALVVLCCAAGPLAAQEFHPPDTGRREPASQPASQVNEPGCFCFGLFAFSTRAGGQLNKDQQAVIGTTLDIMELGAPQLRLRASAETGFGRPERSIGANAEVYWRFQPDRAPAIPYIGAGIGYYDDGSVDHVWPTVVLGFELPFRSSTHWLIEYHSLDGFSRARFLIGLAAGTSGH